MSYIITKYQIDNKNIQQINLSSVKVVEYISSAALKKKYQDNNLFIQRNFSLLDGQNIILNAGQENDFNNLNKSFLVGNIYTGNTKISSEKNFIWEFPKEYNHPNKNIIWSLQNSFVHKTIGNISNSLIFTLGQSYNGTANNIYSSFHLGKKIAPGYMRNSFKIGEHTSIPYNLPTEDSGTAPVNDFNYFLGELNDKIVGFNCSRIIGSSIQRETDRIAEDGSRYLILPTATNSYLQGNNLIYKGCLKGKSIYQSNIFIFGSNNIFKDIQPLTVIGNDNTYSINKEESTSDIGIKKGIILGSNNSINLENTTNVKGGEIIIGNNVTAKENYNIYNTIIEKESVITMTDEDSWEKVFTIDGQDLQDCNSAFKEDSHAYFMRDIHSQFYINKNTNEVFFVICGYISNTISNTVPFKNTFLLVNLAPLINTSRKWCLYKDYNIVDPTGTKLNDNISNLQFGGAVSYGIGLQGQCYNTITKSVSVLQGNIKELWLEVDIDGGNSTSKVDIPFYHCCQWKGRY